MWWSINAHQVINWNTQGVIGNEGEGTDPYFAIFCRFLAFFPNKNVFFCNFYKNPYLPDVIIWTYTHMEYTWYVLDISELLLTVKGPEKTALATSVWRHMSTFTDSHTKTVKVTICLHTFLERAAIWQYLLRICSLYISSSLPDFASKLAAMPKIKVLLSPEEKPWYAEAYFNRSYIFSDNTYLVITDIYFKRNEHHFCWCQAL